MLLGHLQEGIITLLAFDEKHAPIIRGIVGPELYGGPFRLISARIYAHIDRFKKPPGDHLTDILIDKLDDNDNKREASLYADIVEAIFAAKDTINAEYVMAQLETFIKRQSLRGIAVDLHKALQRDTDQSLEEAERLLASASKVNLSVFDPGIRLSDKSRALEFLDTQESALPTGIPELDKRGFGPTRKEMFLYVADTKTGKTWFLIHLAKMAIMHRAKVCHISLEMSATRSAQRYYQSLFGISKRKEPLRITKFQKDQLGRITGFDDLKVMPKLSMDDPKFRAKLERRIDKWSTRLLDRIIIKEFPTGSLTVRQLEAYLDNLEASEQFVPDLLIIDYPDLMRLDKDNYRLALDEVFKDIRGILVKRNIAGAVVSQSHRAASKAKLVRADNVAESYSKIQHADAVLTFSQTAHERKLGLARLHVAAGRNDESHITIVISQQYALGGYVMDSVLLRGNYFNLIPHDESEE